MDEQECVFQKRVDEVMHNLRHEPEKIDAIIGLEDRLRMSNGLEWQNIKELRIQRGESPTKTLEHFAKLHNIEFMK